MSTRKRIASGVTVALAAGVGAAAYYERPCEHREGCIAAARPLGYRAILGSGDLVYQDFSISTRNSRTHVYNLTRTTIGKATIRNAMAYYESTVTAPASRPETIHLHKGTSTKLPFTIQSSELGLHYLVMVPPTKAMPLNVENDGLTQSDQNNDVSTSVVRSNLDHTDPASTEALFTELCQASVDVSTPRSVSQNDRPLVDDLGKESFCNGAGIAMSAAYADVSYPSYLSILRTEQANGPYVTYIDGATGVSDGIKHNLTLDTFSRSSYAVLQSTINQ